MTWRRPGSTRRGRGSAPGSASPSVTRTRRTRRRSAGRPLHATIPLEILAQPDDVTCGPTCLHAVYGFYGDRLGIQRVIDEVIPLETRGTMAVYLANHALERGYGATLYTYNLEVFDPTWFRGEVDLAERLRAQVGVKDRPRLGVATKAYLRFLELGGTLAWEELSPDLLVRQLRRGRPVLTGLSATYLYGTAREVDDGDRIFFDDLRGEAAGHFVVLYGYRATEREVLVADPLRENPLGPPEKSHHYAVGIDRLLGAIMLGVLTYDGNLLVLEPPGNGRRTA